MACNTEDLNPSEIILGCTDPTAINFDVNATVDDGSCVYPEPLSGCTDPSASNYNISANTEDCSCIYCEPNMVIENGVISYLGPPITIGDVPDGADGNEATTVAGRQVINETRGAEVVPIFETQQPSTPIANTGNFAQFSLSEECCDITTNSALYELTEGQETTYINGECVLNQVETVCPSSLTINADGILLDGTTGIPVTQECCSFQEGFNFFPNQTLETANNNGIFTGLCIKEDFTPEEPCDLTLDDVIYVGDTIVYNSTLVTNPGDIEGPGGIILVGGNPQTGGNTGGNTGPCTGGFTITSWDARRVGNSAGDLGDNIANPSTGIQYTTGTYLLTFITSDDEALDLLPGGTIEFSGIQPLVGNDIAYPSGTDGNPIINIKLVDQIPTVVNVTQDISGIKTIITEIIVTDFVNINEISSVDSERDTGGASICPVYPNTPPDGGDPGDGNGGDPGDGNEGGDGNGGDPGDGGVLYPCVSFNSFTMFPISFLTNSFPFADFSDFNYLDMCNGEVVATNGFDYYMLLRYGPGFDSSIVECGTYSLTVGLTQEVNDTCWSREITYEVENQSGVPTPTLYEFNLSEGTLVKIITKRLSTDGTEGYALVNISIPQTQGDILNSQPDCALDNFINFSSPPTANLCLVPGGSNLPIIGGVDNNGNRTSGNELRLLTPGTATPIFTTQPTAQQDPCAEPGVIVPQLPDENDPTNPFTNLSEVCCLTLGSELGWEFIDGVCYWKPPTPTVTTEFGLSENDIIVEDIDCPILTITGSFYLERPDNVDCEPESDVTASLVIYTGDTLSNTQIPTEVIETFTLSNDGYCQWTDMSSTIINNFNTPFKVKLVLSGVKDCCEYDIFVDDLQVLCTKQDAITVNTSNLCPGFRLRRVIDNKKSWSQNIETPINRVFAPSPDADLPWRYTDYFNQSGVYDNDSRLVMNSKEVDLLFNMKKPVSPCPDGFTYNPNNDNCLKPSLTCPSNYTLSGETCFSGTTTIITTSASTGNEVVSRLKNSCNTDLSIYDLINYKRNFQNYWVKFVEQFIPATTIFVSGEKWSNRNDEICPTIKECEYDNLFTTKALGIEQVGSDTRPIITPSIIDGRNTRVGSVSDVVISNDNVTSIRSGNYGDNKQSGPIILENFVGSYIKKDNSIIKEGTLTFKKGELNLLSKGKNKFENKLIVFNR